MVRYLNFSLSVFKCQAAADTQPHFIFILQHKTSKLTSKKSGYRDHFNGDKITKTALENHKNKNIHLPIQDQPSQGWIVEIFFYDSTSKVLVWK